ncbi:MAG: twin-arginine translocase subunit TatC [Micavibrio aeruginosavorus]|uniref:Sec-independent protein translocase protein TatC n=1 Tax=Micavibrio aeruginosavorus TaxID=349221 RepID=A0A2W5HBK3_9BACT|nr:MAG: twin-arginine translocase subunit TatC [Micavibrio aeruginosavorus]
MITDLDSTSQPLIDHLTELRKRVLWSVVIMLVGTGICYHFRDNIYGFLVKPLADAMGPDDSQRLIYTNLTEAFFTYVKVSVFAGCFLTFPFLATQIWMFISPGLYKREKAAMLPFLIAAPIMFFLGGALVYYIVIPGAWKFFLSFQSSGSETVLPIMLEAKVSDYLDLIMVLIFAFGLAFQMPIVLALMAKAGIISAQWLAAKRRYAIVLIFIVAAIITPPDIISQIALAIPLMILYEISILLIRRSSKNPNANTP